MLWVPMEGILVSWVSFAMGPVLIGDFGMVRKAILGKLRMVDRRLMLGKLGWLAMGLRLARRLMLHRLRILASKSIWMDVRVMAMELRLVLGSRLILLILLAIRPMLVRMRRLIRLVVLPRVGGILGIAIIRVRHMNL